MMTPFGAPYEFLWANPYQPGLSYYQLPLVFHDANSGTLFVRSGWDEDADWFGLYGGRGRAVSRRPRHGGEPGLRPVLLPPSLCNWAMPASSSDALRFDFRWKAGTMLVIGLKPRQKYLVETDDEEMREVSTDRAGTFVLQYPAGPRGRRPRPRMNRDREGELGLLNFQNFFFLGLDGLIQLRDVVVGQLLDLVQRAAFLILADRVCPSKAS